MVNITVDASVLDSSAITICSGIINNLTDAAIEDAEVWGYKMIILCIYIINFTENLTFAIIIVM